MTGDIFAKLLTACAGDWLVDLRDRALLLMAFAFGGRRRSEVAGLHVEDLVDESLFGQIRPKSTPLSCPA